MVPRRCARAAGHDGAAVEQGRSAGRGTDQAKFAKLEAVGCPRAHDAIRTVLRFADTSEDSILLGSLECKRIHYGRAVAQVQTIFLDLYSVGKRPTRTVVRVVPSTFEAHRADDPHHVADYRLLREEVHALPPYCGTSSKVIP